jgi:hypothetical protein
MYTVVLRTCANVNHHYDVTAPSREVALCRARTRHYQATGDTCAYTVIVIQTVPAAELLSA